MKEKSKYLNAECEILLLSEADVIATSVTVDSGDGNIDGGGWT